MKRYNVEIEVVDRLGPKKCHHHHEKGEKFTYESNYGELCPMAAHALYPYVEIARYGGELPSREKTEIRACCPDVDVINVFNIRRMD